MFSTLLGALPADPDRATAPAEERTRANLADLETAGVELLAAGEPLDLTSPPDPAVVADAWQRVAAASTRP
ncbi:MAG TPA: hypothetical protein VFY18_14075, partial [Candidatus Limnocylindrales bacterium]|nr:hypothetical protein [Candidatus Limnocylindrales bacterium]